MVAIRVQVRATDDDKGLTTAADHPQGHWVGTWAAANNVEIAYTPTNSSWLNRIEAEFTTLRYFTLDGRVNVA